MLYLTPLITKKTINYDIDEQVVCRHLKHAELFIHTLSYIHLVEHTPEQINSYFQAKYSRIYLLIENPNNQLAQLRFCLLKYSTNTKYSQLFTLITFSSHSMGIFTFTL